MNFRILVKVHTRWRKFITILLTVTSIVSYSTVLMGLSFGAPQFSHAARPSATLKCILSVLLDSRGFSWPCAILLMTMLCAFVPVAFRHSQILMLYSKLPALFLGANRRMIIQGAVC